MANPMVDPEELTAEDREVLAALGTGASGLDPELLDQAAAGAWQQAGRRRRRSTLVLLGTALAAGLLLALLPWAGTPAPTPPAVTVDTWPADDSVELEDLDQRIAMLREELAEVPTIASW
jgi:hypothetical protein